MSIAAVGAENKAVPAAFMTVDGGREDAVLREMRDIPPGKPAVVEYEIDLKRRQAFVGQPAQPCGTSAASRSRSRNTPGRA